MNEIGKNYCKKIAAAVRKRTHQRFQKRIAANPCRVAALQWRKRHPKCAGPQRRNANVFASERAWRTYSLRRQHGYRFYTENQKPRRTL